MDATPGRMVLAGLCFAAAVALVLLALRFFATGYAGPAPMVLAAAGGAVAAGVSVLRGR